MDPELTALSTLSTKLNLAKSIYEQGRESEAVVMLDDVLPRLRDAYPSNSWELAIALQYYGSALTTVRRYEDAEGALRESFAIIEKGATRRRPEELQLIAERLTTLYDAWHLVVPGQGYDTQAEEWRRRSVQ